jgi:FkbM family methyltransferase
MKKLVLYILQFGLVKGFYLFYKLDCKTHGIIKIPFLHKQCIVLRAGTSDPLIFNQIFLYHGYNFAFNLTSPQKVFVDLGANIGLFAIYMKNKYPDAKIICLEPDPDNFSILEKNIASYPNIYCECCGIWNKDINLKVYDKYNRGKKDSMAVEEDLEHGTVQGISMKTLLNKYNIEKVDLLKIDIETSEKQLFSYDYEEWLPKIQTIVIELHDSMLEGCSKVFFEAINESFDQYKFSMCGENVIIENKTKR